ncbi:HAD family hydrolase [Caproiciproducens sp.]
MKRPNAVVFDVDGTLLDTMPVVWAMERVYRERYPGKQVPSELFVKTHSLPRLEGYRRLGIPKKDWDIYYRAVYRELGSQKAAQVLFPGIEEAVDTLAKQGYRLGINTSRSRGELEVARRAQPDLFRLFPQEFCVTIDDVENPKPAADPLLLFCQRSSAKPSDVLFVGDSRADRLCAKAAGTLFAWAGWNRSGFSPPLEENVLCLACPHALLSCLRSDSRP